MDNYLTRIYQTEKKYLEARKFITDDPLGCQIAEVSSVINAKTSALLTHVSIMIAVSTGMFVYLATIQSQYNFIKVILLFEIIAYLVVSLFCLKAISLSSSFISENDRKILIENRTKELSIRRVVYVLALYFTMFLTVVLVAVLCIEAMVLY